MEITPELHARITTITTWVAEVSCHAAHCPADRRYRAECTCGWVDVFTLALEVAADLAEAQGRASVTL